jgi:hypothetical protein
MDQQPHGMPAPPEFVQRVMRSFARPGLFGPRTFTSRDVASSARVSSTGSFKSNVSTCNSYLNAMVLDGLLGRSGGRGTDQKEVLYHVIPGGGQQ